MERNEKVRGEFESRLKAYFARADDACRAPQSDEPNCQPTRQDMIVGIKYRLTDLLEEYIAFQRERSRPLQAVGYSENATARR